MYNTRDNFTCTTTWTRGSRVKLMTNGRQRESRQASTSKSGKSQDGEYRDTNSNATHRTDKSWLKDIIVTTAYLRPSEASSDSLTTKMVKKDLSLSQMCNFFRAAGTTTVEQNVSHQQRRSVQTVSVGNTKKTNNVRLKPMKRKEEYPNTTKERESRTSINQRSNVDIGKKENTIFLTEESLKRINKASAIYLDNNRLFHEQRFKRLQENIENQQRLKFERQLTESHKKLSDQLKRNKTSLTELKNVRKRFWREKQKRVDRTYVSVAALETPEVDRYAYGLPAEGKEYSCVKLPSRQQTRENIKKKWEHSKQKAANIVQMLNMTRMLEKSKTLPILKPLTSHREKKKKITESFEENSVENESDKMKISKEFTDVSSEISSIQEDSESDFDSEF